MRWLVYAGACAVAVDGFGLVSMPASRTAPRSKRSGTTAMGDKANNTPAKYAPKGAFGGYAKPGEASQQKGWIGDRSKSLQIRKFEKGEDFLFFQGPAPKTGVQEDLPSFFSPDNFADIQIKPIQIAVTATGIGTFAAAAAVIVQG